MNDLWLFDRETARDLPLYRRLRHPTESEVASVLSDSALDAEWRRRNPRALVLLRDEHGNWPKFATDEFDYAAEGHYDPAAFFDALAAAEEQKT